MKKLLSYSLILIAVMFFASCKKKTTNIGLHIPKEAGVVIHINGKSIQDKLPWEEIKKNNFIEETLKDSTLKEFSRKMIENPENSGVDTKNDFLYFYVPADDKSYVGIEGTIKDEAKLQAFAKEIFKSAEQSKEGEINFISNKNGTLSWKKNNFIALVDINKLKEAKSQDYNIEDTSGIQNINPNTSTPSFDYKKTLTDLYNLAKDKSISTDEKFALSLNDDADAHFYVNVENIYKNSGLVGGMASMLNASKYIDGMVYTGDIHFEKGKILANSQTYAGKELMGIFEKYKGSGIDKEMLKKINGTPLAMYAFNFKPQGFLELLKLGGFDGMINSMMKKEGLSLEDFVKANKGDLLMAMMNVDGNDAKGFFAASIGDKEAFNKLISIGKKMAGDEKVTYNVNDKYFVIGNDAPTVNNFNTNTSGKIPDQAAGVFDGTFGGYGNLKKIMELEIGKNSYDSAKMLSQAANAKVWDYFTVKGGDIKNNSMRSTTEIYLQDKEKNSLVVLNNLANEISVIEKKYHKSAEEALSEYLEPAADTIIPAPSKGGY